MQEEEQEDEKQDEDINSAMFDMVRTFNECFEDLTLEEKRIYVRNIVKEIRIKENKTLESLVLVNGDIIKF